MFLSAQSFASLEGKGLLCTYDPIKIKNVKPEAYFFHSEKYYALHNINLTGDIFSIKSDETRLYQTDKDFIYLGMYYKVNRKNLDFINRPDEITGKCEVFNNHKKLQEKHIEIRDKFQEEYNKSLEGNKI